MGLQPQLEEGIQEVLTAAQASRSQVLGSNKNTAGFGEESHGHLGWSADEVSTATDAARGNYLLMSFLMVLLGAASGGADHSPWRSDPWLKLDQRSSDSLRKVWWPMVAQLKASES